MAENQKGSRPAGTGAPPPPAQQIEAERRAAVPSTKDHVANRMEKAAHSPIPVHHAHSKGGRR
jgi:hypothetical protein